MEIIEMNYRTKQDTILQKIIHGSHIFVVSFNMSWHDILVFCSEQQLYYS